MAMALGLPYFFFFILFSVRFELFAPVAILPAAHFPVACDERYSGRHARRLLAPISAFQISLDVFGRWN